MLQVTPFSALLVKRDDREFLRLDTEVWYEVMRGIHLMLSVDDEELIDELETELEKMGHW